MEAQPEPNAATPVWQTNSSREDRRVKVAGFLLVTGIVLGGCGPSQPPDETAVPVDSSAAAVGGDDFADADEVADSYDTSEAAVSVDSSAAAVGGDDFADADEMADSYDTRVGYWSDNLGMEFVWIPKGEFRMGSASHEAERDEEPITRVRISRGFWLGKHEVTQAEWEVVMGENPSEFSGCGRCPVESVSWEDTQAFIRRLNERDGKDLYRLPTEAEWEYAARAGTTVDRYARNLDAVAWYGDNSGGWTHPVAQKESNAFGLHDMLGNVGEWVQDWYGRYPGTLLTDPRGAGPGPGRVTRGGSWIVSARSCRASDRGNLVPSDRNSRIGFRLLRTGE